MADDPSAPSSDYRAMQPFWAMVEAILGGAETMREIKGGSFSIPGPPQPVANLAELNRGRNPLGGPESPYLPRLPNENFPDYDYRRKHAPFTNIYGDISEDLAGKPFTKTLELEESTPEDLKTLSENIDGQGNNLHVFGSTVFKAALDKSITWILVDYTNVPPGATLADEKKIGARPYWVHVQPERMLAVYSDFLNGQEIITHARIYEPVNQRSGYGEQCVERVRVFNREPLVDANNKVIGYAPALWELYEAVDTDTDGKKQRSWIVVDQGAVTIGVIPLIPIILGKRIGMTWKATPPLKDIAHMQVEEFQQESNLKYIKEMTAFPMLAGNGVGAPKDKDGEDIIVPVGPKAVLFAPMGSDGRHGEWVFIEPTAESLKFLKDDLEAFRNEMRELGKQPLASANLTVVTTANISMRAHSAVQAWAIKFKDALEQAWVVTCKWLNRTDDVEVEVYTDFGVDLEAGTELTELNKSTWLSDYDKAAEFKRRGVLRDSFDWDENELRLAEQQQGLQPEQPLDPVTGQPIDEPPPNQQPGQQSGQQAQAA